MSNRGSAKLHHTSHMFQETSTQQVRDAQRQPKLQLELRYSQDRGADVDPGSHESEERRLDELLSQNQIRQLHNHQPVAQSVHEQ